MTTCKGRVFGRQRALLTLGTQEKHAATFPVEHERDGQHRLYGSRPSFGSPELADLREHRILRDVGHEHRSLCAERRDEFGIAIDADLQRGDRWIVERRDDRSRDVADVGQHHRAMLEVQGARDATREHAIDLRRGEVGRNFVQDLHELARCGDVVQRALQFLLAALQRVSHLAHVVARP